MGDFVNGLDKENRKKKIELQMSKRGMGYL